MAVITRDLKLALLRAMLNTRINDDAEQALKRRGQGHFQLAADGHEALAAVGLAMRPEDWLHPHYRDRPIVMARGVPHDDFFLDYFGKATAPSGGRQMPVHFNSRRHRIISVSTPVASNVLQAVGMAMSLKERGVKEVVVASAGDAATREGEVTEAIMQAATDKLPVVFLIEDNRFGISTNTEGKTFWTMPHGMSSGNGAHWYAGCRVQIVDGLDPVAVYEASLAALERARAGNGPTCLVAKVERLKSHSSSDDQRVYRTAEDLNAIQSKDPVKRYIERCIEEKVVTPSAVEELKAAIQSEVDAAIERARHAPEPDPKTVAGSAFAELPESLPAREQRLPAHLSKRSGGLTMAQCIDITLQQELDQNPRVCLFGEDIEDPKGDVFGITRGLSRKFPGRVKNSPLAEATIVGCGVGRAILGDTPVATIQFIDFLGPGLNQVFNEMVTLHWRSRGQWNCPMTIMAPYGAYLPGLGPWHSQSNEAIFAHLPGLHVVIPSGPGDAAGLLRFALRCNRPVLYLYPKALLHGAEDTVQEPDPECIVPFGQARIVRPGRDVTLVTWGNGVTICRAAAHQAAREGIEAEILDLRTITPWDVKAVLQSIARTGRLVVVHEDAKTCGLGGEIIAEIVSTTFDQLRAVPQRVTKPDDFNPYHYSLELALLPSADSVLKAMREQVHQDLRPGRKVLDAAQGIGVAAAQGPAPVAPARAPVSSETLVLAPGHVEIMVPRQSPTDEDATVVRYLVKAGDSVKMGTPVAEMEANKGSFEVESTHNGVVARIHVKEGERVRVESPLLTLEVGAEAAAAAPAVLEAAIAEAGKPPPHEIPISPAQMQVGRLAMKSQLEIPRVSVECEVDMSSVVRQREAVKKEFESKFGVHPTYTHLLLWSIVRAMMTEQHEGFRGRLAPAADKLIVDPHASIGFAAVGPKESLYSPVVKNADALSFVAFARRVHEMTETVRSGHIHSADLQGATLTLTNIGAFEATSGTPFIIPGQLAMIAAGSMLERPRFVSTSNGKRNVEPHMILNLRLVFDHRPFNGSHAASFLRTIKHTLESLDLKALMKE